MSSIKKNILFVEHSNSGGLAHYAHEVCSAMVDLGYEVTLICPGTFEIPINNRNYTVVESQTQNGSTKVAKGIQNIKFAFNVIAEARKSDFDIVFLDGYQMNSQLILLFFQSRGLPVFCIQHEVEPRIGKKRISIFQKDFYNRVTAMIVHRNNYSEELLKTKYKVRKSIFTIDHGLYNVNSFGKTKLECKCNKTNMLSFGTVRADKGLDLLVKAYPGREKCNNLDLMIVGKAKGKYGEYFSRIVEAKADIIWDRKFIPSSEIASIYNSAAFVVLPFLECTQSGSLRLAMLFEVPVIATDVGEMPAFFQKYQVGILVKRGDIKDLVQAIVKLSNDETLRSTYIDNIKKLNNSSEMSWNKIIDRLFTEINEKKIW